MEEFLYPHFYEVENTHWWFAARQRILWEFMERKLRFPATLRLLDVGCGTGAILDMLSKKYHAYGQDVAPQAIAFCAQRGLQHLFCGTLDRFPSTEEQFDIITSFDVIEHIDDDLGTLRQMYNLLQDNGTLLVTVPAFPSLWGTHDVVTHHKRRYVRRTLTSVVEQAGFRVEYLSYFNFFLFPIAVVRRLLTRWSNPAESEDYTGQQQFRKQGIERKSIHPSR